MAVMEKFKDMSYKDELSQKRAKARSSQWYGSKPKSDQIELLIKRFLTQLIDENRGKGLLEVDYTDKERIARRKDQMVIVKDTMAIIRQLRELKEVVKDDEAAKEKSSPTSLENQVLLDSANELMKKIGVKPDMEPDISKLKVVNS